RHGVAFRRGPDDGFTVSAIDTDKAGAQHVRMAQTYKGIPVVGGALDVHLSRDAVTGISGRFIADLALQANSSAANSAQAAAVAVAFARNEGHQNARSVRTAEPAIFVDGGHSGHL